MQRKPIAMALALAGAIGLGAAPVGFAADTGGSTSIMTNATTSMQAGTPTQGGVAATSSAPIMSRGATTTDTRSSNVTIGAWSFATGR